MTYHTNWIQKRWKIQNFDILAVCNRYLLHCCCSFSFHSSWFCYFLFTFWFWILTPFLDNKFIPNDAPHFTLAVKRFVISNLILSKRLLWSEIQNCRQKSRCWLLEKSARMREFACFDGWREKLKRNNFTTMLTWYHYLIYFSSYFI